MQGLQDLHDGAHALGIELDDRQLDRFARYASLLEEWNAHLNLTRIPPHEYVPLHFLDSLTIASAVDVKAITAVIDVGSGAGLPGVALKIAFPQLSVTLLDSTQKRLRF